MNILDKLYEKAKRIKDPNKPYMCIVYYDYDIKEYITNILHINAELNFSKEWETLEQANKYAKELEDKDKDFIIIDIKGETKWQKD